MELKEFFEQHPDAALAFSGGVDSAYLLYAAVKYARRVRAYYVKSAFQPEFELEDAVKIAGITHADMKILNLDILSCEDVTSNPTERCYYCKKHIFGAIMEAAKADGFEVILDGTNASDDAGDRPGMRALAELKVMSPLRLCGLTKPEIRRLSEEAGLFTWNKPAYACLATRIPAGQHIEAELLERTEKAEMYLASLGFKNHRVRAVGNGAKLQIRESDADLFEDKKEEILKKLGEAYENVVSDTEYRNEL